MPLACRHCEYSRPLTADEPGTVCPICLTPYPEADLAELKAIRDARAGWWVTPVSFGVAVLSVAGLWNSMFGDSEKPELRRLSLKDEFSEAISVPWIEEYHQGIAYALGMERVTGCGSFRYKRIPKRSGIYLVECSDRHDQKTGYKVGPDSGLVLGPLHFLETR